MRRLLKLIGILILLIILGAVGLFLMLPTKQIVEIAAEQVRAATGRNLQISGDVSPSFYPVLGVEAEGVSFSNAKWGEAPSMMTAEAVKVGVELIPLITGDIRVSEIRLVKPVIALEVDETGRGNWVFDTAEPASAEGEGGGLPRKLSLGETNIVDGSLSYVDRATGQTIRAEAINARISLTALDQPLRVDGDAVWNGEKTEIELELTSVATLMAGGETKLVTKLEAAPLKLSFDGVVAPPAGNAPPEAAGAYSIASADPAAAARWATGQAVDGLEGLTDVTLEGRFAMDSAALGLTATGGAARGGRRMSFDIDARGDGGWREKRAFALNVAGGVDGLVRVTFEGVAAAPEGGAPSAEGRLSLDASDLRALAEFAGAEPPMENPDAFRKLQLEATLSVPSPDALRMKVDRLVFNAIEATGDLSVNMGDKIAFAADLTTGALNLDPYITDGGEDAPGGAGWSRDPIDLTGLGAVDGDVKLRAASVKARQVELGATDIAATLSGGQLALKIRELGLYGGGVKGDVAVDGLKGNALKARVDVAEVQLQPLLNAFTGVNFIRGVGRLSLDVTSAGASIHDIMNALDGQGSLLLSDGAIIGYNLAAMVRNVKGAFTGGGGGEASTDFSEVSATFRIEDGLLTNADFKFLGPLIRIVGEGDVGLGARDINFRLTPKAVTTLKGQGGAVDAGGLAFPLRITGPWESPTILPDLEAGITDLLKNPDAAANAVKSLAGDGAGGVAKEALGGLTGGGGDATKKVLEGLTGGGSSEDGGGLGGLLKKLGD